MGLGISHLKLTLTPNKESGIFTLDYWEDDCNVALSHYSKYITMVDDLPTEKTIVIVKNEEQFELLKESAYFIELACEKVFVGEINNEMKEQIIKYCGHDKLKKFKPLSYNSGQKVVHCHTYLYEAPIKVKGFYYDDIGYQRKGMSSLFYPIFIERNLWGNLSDFELAYSCIGGEWYLEHWGQETVDEMKRDFKANFIDKFEFGRSLLYVSW